MPFDARNEPSKRHKTFPINIETNAEPKSRLSVKRRHSIRFVARFSFCVYVSPDSGVLYLKIPRWHWTNRNKEGKKLTATLRTKIQVFLRSVPFWVSPSKAEALEGSPFRKRRGRNSLALLRNAIAKWKLIRTGVTGWWKNNRRCYAALGFDNIDPVWVIQIFLCFGLSMFMTDMKKTSGVRTNWAQFWRNTLFNRRPTT